MRYLFLISSLFLIASIPMQSQEYLQMIEDESYSVSEIVANAESYFENKDKGRGSGYKQYKRWEYMANRLMKDNGFLPSQKENLQELERYNAYLNTANVDKQSLTDNWVEMGPTSWNASTSWSPGLGRVTSFSVETTNTDHIIIGAETGGVWKSTNDGATWLPLGDYFSNLSVYAVTIDPTNADTYYFGSTSGLIYRSTDAGATWLEIADLSTSIINKIVINPNNPDVIFASSQNAGFYGSFDGGTTWTDLISSENRAYDIEFMPGNTDVVYASGNSFHKSIDGGQTFTTLPSNFENGPKMMGVSAHDVNTVYVIEAASGSFNALYKSIDAGENFIKLDHEGRNYFGYDTNGFQSGGNAPRDMDISVNPENVNEVHIAGVLNWRSMDGGISFDNTADWIPNQAANAGKGYCHADVDIIEFVGTTLYVGTDGGIFRATDTANLTANYFEDISAGLGIRQFYKIGVSQTQELVVTGGSQDNGSSFFTENTGWIDWIGADGMEGFVSKSSNNTLFGMIQNGGLYRTNNQGTTLTGLSWPGNGSSNWVTPLEDDPVEANTLYAANTSVYKSTNNGASWSAISQAIPRNIDFLKIAQSNNQIMYFIDTSRIYKTLDGGDTDWVQITAPGGNSVRSIAIHPTDPDKLAVASSHSNKVFVSFDGGDSWENYKKNLPNFSAITIIWDDNGQDGLYLGMDYGIYYIDNMQEEWRAYNTNLPNVIINELEINHTTNTLYAGTYGRGLWASPLVEDVLGTQNFLNQENVVLTPNPASSKVSIVVPQATEASVRLFDVKGALLQYHKNILLDNTFTINIESFNAGVYFVRISTNSGTITKKIIKQ